MSFLCDSLKAPNSFLIKGHGKTWCCCGNHFISIPILSRVNQFGLLETKKYLPEIKLEDLKIRAIEPKYFNHNKRFNDPIKDSETKKYVMKI